MTHQALPLSYVPNQIPNRTQWANRLQHHLAHCNQVFQIEPVNTLPLGGLVQFRITFLNLSLQDSESESHLMLIAYPAEHAEPLLCFGAIRQLCGNRMLFSTAVEEWIQVPEDSLSLEELPGILEALPAIRSAAQKRINWMQRLRIRDRHLRAVEERISAELAGRISDQLQLETLTQWQLHNLLIHHIAREVPATQQRELLLQVSRLFKL